MSSSRTGQGRAHRAVRGSGATMSLCLLGICLALAPSTSALAAHRKSPAPAAGGVSESAETTLRLVVGSQKLVRESGSIRRVAIGSPRVADINVINARELLLIGKGPGSTTLMVWPAGGGAPVNYVVRVDVPGGGKDSDMADTEVGDDGTLSGTSKSLFAHRRSEFAAQTTQKAVAASGSNGGDGEGGSSDSSKLKDSSEVVLDSQVMSQIKIVEVNKTTLQEFGFNFFRSSGTVTGGIAAPSTISGVSSASSPLSVISSNGFLPIQSAFNLLLGNSKTNIFGALSILENRGLARTLAEPSLTAMSGQTASFLAGGEFPIPIPQAGSGITPTITIQYKEYGVRLNLTPTVLANNRIALKIAPEVSELDYTNAVNIDGFVIPGLIVRRTDTFVELGDGESFVISGLVSEEIKNNVDKVPWLGDVPFIGAFFRDTSISRADKELIMVVTPHLVHPLRKDDQLPPLPGESVSKYDPSFAQTMFLESGDFGQTPQSGYSR